MLLGILMINMLILNPGMRQGTGSLVQVSQDQPVATQYPGRGGRNPKADVFGVIQFFFITSNIVLKRAKTRPDEFFPDGTASIQSLSLASSTTEQ